MISVNPFLPVAKLADQVARPIVNVVFRRRGPHLLADDDAAIREYVRLACSEKPRKPYIPAPVSDEQFDADRAREEGDWCGND